MKAIQTNAENVGISLLYCFVALVSFLILKASLKYLQNHKQKNLQENMKNEHLSKYRLQRLNYLKVFTKAYALKNTLIGSIFNKDKKYLLKELFIISSIGICCFKINKYIIWPWGVGLGLFILTTLIFQLLIPLLTKKKTEQSKIYQERTLSSKRQSLSDANSIQIQHTQLQASVSIKRDLVSQNQIRQKDEKQDQQKQPFLTKFNIEIIFIMCLAFTSLIFLSASILNLSTSVSNSGVLNVISLGICLLIDQIFVRTGFFIVSGATFITLHITNKIPITQNQIFLQFSNEQIIKDAKKLQEQNKIQQMNNKIHNINNPKLYQGQQTENQKQTNGKMIFQEASHQYLVENSYLQSVKQEEKSYQQAIIQQKQEQIQDQKQNQIQIDPHNYFQLQPYDVQMFKQNLGEIQRLKKVKFNKYKKRSSQSSLKSKSDPFLYFPYQEHKLTRKINKEIQQNQQENQQQQEEQHQNRQIEKLQEEQSYETSLKNQDNLISKIKVIQCLQDQFQSQQPQIGVVLHQRNPNIQTLPQITQTKIPPTSRSKQKHSYGSNVKSMKKVKKVSPYLVDLGQQAIKPKKSKKLSLSNLNKQNDKQMNNSFLPSENIELSHVKNNKNHTKSALSNFQTINYNTISTNHQISRRN